MKPILTCGLFLTCLTSCSVRDAYYFSPFNGNTITYHTTPLQIDSVKDATYGSLSLAVGGANDVLRDNVSGFRHSLYRSHSREDCQFFYGGSLTLGSYRVKEYDTVGSVYNNYRRNGKIINQFAGNKFFGGLALNAGVNYTIQFRERHEWRFGAESALLYEFGNYLKFRKQIPDSAVTIVHRERHFFTLGLYSEFAFKTRSGSVGFKISIGTPLGSNYLDGNRYTEKFLPFFYISPAFQYTNRRWTGFVQLNLAQKAFYSQLGTNYRLNYKTRKNR